MQNEKGYALENVGNDRRSTKTYNAIQASRIRKLKPGKKIFIASTPVYEFGYIRLISHAKNLGEKNGLNIGPDGRTDYSYILNDSGDETQLFIRRNR